MISVMGMNGLMNGSNADIGRNWLKPAVYVYVEYRMQVESLLRNYAVIFRLRL